MSPTLEELIADQQKNLKEGVAIFLKNGSVGLTSGILSEPMKAAWQAALQTVLAGLPEQKSTDMISCGMEAKKEDGSLDLSAAWKKADQHQGFNAALSEVKNVIEGLKV